MRQGRPRVILIGGTYRALCVLERLIDRGENVVAFIGQEGGGERDFCPEILEVCERHAIPARSARKLGEEIVRWLEDRIRPDLAITVGGDLELPLAIGGNCRLGLIELMDFFHSEACPGVVLRQHGHEVLRRDLRIPADHEEAGDAYLRMVDEMLSILDTYLDELAGSRSETEIAISFESPPLSADELELATAAADAGAETRSLEEEAAAYLGADRVVALHSAAAAFWTLIEALGLSAGDEVICSAIASSAAVDALRDRGVTPIFADVLPGCATLDPERVAEMIGERTRALMISHAFGQPADLASLYEIASDAGIEVFEDAGSALGARFEDSRIGRSPCTCVFRLPLAGQAPGATPALVSVPASGADLIESMVADLRLNDGLASLARRRLEAWDSTLSARRHVATRYSSELVRYDAFRVPHTPEGRMPCYGSYALRLTRFARTTAEDLHKLLTESGVQTRLLRLPAIERELLELPVAGQIRNETILLPLFPELEDREIDLVLDVVFGFAIG